MQYFSAYLLAVVGGVFHTHKLLVGPAVQVGVLSADVSVPSIAGLALTAEHGLCVVPQVDTAGVRIAVVGSVIAGVTRLTDLQTRPRRSVYLPSKSQKHRLLT